jgi:hypothetical protein
MRQPLQKRLTLTRWSERPGFSDRSPAPSGRAEGRPLGTSRSPRIRTEIRLRFQEPVSLSPREAAHA